ncbi:MAG: DNA gyrase C-terminal beta-propeller domain-containing protein, partial [Pseudomonadota bacterium]
SDLSIEDLIPESDVVVTLSHAGYAKAQSPDTYQAQKRGGRGRSATRMKDEDFIEHLFVANTHDTLLCFSSRGKVYWLKVYQLPQAGRGSRGKPIVNLLPLEQDERINAVVPTREFPADRYVIFATRNGTVKRTSLEAFSRPRSNGIIAIDIREDDALVDVAILSAGEDVMLFANSGKAIRFASDDVRAMGRGAAGVRGIKVSSDQAVIAMRVVRDEEVLLIATEHGFGKRTAVADFNVQGRGGQGVIAIQASDRNGRCVGALRVAEDDEVMLISHQGTLVRTSVSEISQLGRNTQGVTLIRLDEGDLLTGLARIEAIDDEEAE